MLTKGAIGNLINRYKAVLKKCNLINTFGSLAVASMLVLGDAGVAGATDHPAMAPPKKTFDGATATFNLGDKIAGGWFIEGDITLTEEMTTGLNTDTTYKNITLSSEGDGTTKSERGGIFGGNYVKKLENILSIPQKQLLTLRRSKWFSVGRGLVMLA